MQRAKMSRFKYLIIFVFAVFCLTSLHNCEKEHQGQHFYFVQITDTHFETGDNIARSHKAIELINTLPMDIKCVVHTGDITTADKLEEQENRAYIDTALAIMGNINVPVHYVAGNHDIFPEKLETTTRIFKENFGELISQVEYENVVFIFVFTEPLRKSFTVDGYDPLVELEGYLKKAKADGKPVIVFHHAPSVKDFYNNEYHSSWDKAVFEKWIKLLNDYEVKGVITGHYHRDEFHWLENVPLYVSPPISGWWGRQAAFRIYEFRDGKIGYRTQYLN